MPDLRIPDYVREAQQRSTESAQRAGQFTSDLYQIPSRLREAINEKVRNNQDLIRQKNRAEAEFFSAPAKAREEFIRPIGSEDYLTPQAVESLVSQRKEQAFTPFANLSDILTQRQGRLEDIVGETTGLFQAQAGAAQSQADIDRQNFEDLQSQFFNQANLDLQQQQLDISRSKAGAGAQPTAGSLLLQQLLGPQATGPALPEGVAGPELSETTDQPDLNELFGMTALAQADTPAEIKTALDILRPKEPEKSGEVRKLEANAQTGLDSIDFIAERLGVDGSGKFKRAPLLPAVTDREFNFQRETLQDVIQRLRTGAAINETEFEFYSDQVPVFWDDEDTVRAKLETFKGLFNQILTGERVVSDQPTPSPVGTPSFIPD